MIAADMLDAIAEAVRHSPDSASLRSRFPGLHVTECGEDDMPVRANPVRETPSHLIYLVTGASGHCLSLTHETDLATGIVVASRCADD